MIFKKNKLLLLLAVFFINSCGDDDSQGPATIIEVSDTTFTIPENPSNGDEIGVVAAAATRGGEVQEVVFSLTSQTPNGAIVINANSGQVTVADAGLFDFEVNPSITASLEITSNEVSKTISLTINVTNVTEITSENTTLSLEENPNNGAVIGTVMASVDQGNLSFGILEQSPEGAIAIDASSGQITVADSSQFDFETHEKIEARIELSSGGASNTIEITINIVNILEVTVEDINVTIPENPTQNQVLGTVIPTADMENLSFNFRIESQSSDGAFIIIENDNGISIAVNDPEIFDFETTPLVSGTFSATADDDNSTSVIFQVEVNLTDANDAPTITDQTFEALESISTSENIGSILATDADGDNLEFILSEDIDDLFSVIRRDGTLSLKEDRTLDFETKTTHTISVEVSDGSLTSSATITINVKDVEFEGNWFVVGTNGDDIVPGGTNGNDDLVVGENGTLYLAFQDVGNSDFLYVKTFNGTQWEQLGTAVSGESVFSAPTISVFNNVPYVAYNSFDNSAPEINGLKMRRYNESNATWEPVGNGLITTNLNTNDIHVVFDRSDIYVAYNTLRNRQRFIEVKQLDANNHWVDVGTNPVATFNERLTTLPFFGIRQSNQELVVVDHSLNVITKPVNSGADWVTQATSGVARIDLLDVEMDNNGNLFTFSGELRGPVRLYKLNGTTWEDQVTGQVTSSPGRTLTLDLTLFNNTPFVGTTDFQSFPRINVFRVENQQWVDTGNRDFLSNVSQSPTLRFNSAGTPFILLLVRGKTAVYSIRR